MGMSKKKHRSAHTGTGTMEQVVKPAASKKSAGSKTKNFNSPMPSDKMLVLGIAVITWLFYSVSLSNQFTNWDDLGYVKDNPLVKDLSAEGIKNIFSLPVMGNYHPLTILSYAIEYSFFGLDPWIYHFDNLLLHVLVTILVFYFVKQLTAKPLAAVIAALLFGLHPMHVESVAWISGRKDMMYSIFYIAAMITYLAYARNTDQKKAKWYGLTLFFFICSLLGKPVAVILPVTLFLLDYFEKRKLQLSLLTEKIPLFLIAIGFGIKSVIDQNSIGALATKSIGFSVLERIALGSYALVNYLWKAVVPAGLSCVYPYPQRTENGLDMSYFIYPLIVLSLAFLVWRFARKNRVVMFGILFFGVNIALLLQFIPVGGAILADRYTYIPYLGFFIIAGCYVAEYSDRHVSNKYLPVAAMMLYIIVLGFVTRERSKVWYDTISLWKDEIKKHPEFPEAYNNLGFHYFDKYNLSKDGMERKLFYDSSYNLLNTAINIKPDFAKAYVSLGELERVTGKFNEAKNYYYRALSFDEERAIVNAYLGLGITYAMNNEVDSAGKYLSLAVQKQPQFPEGHNSYGNFFVMRNMPDSAIKEYSLAISQNPDMYDPYLNRARLLQQMKRCNEAMNDFAAAIQLMPERPEAYYARSFCYADQGNRSLALQDVERAISLGFTAVDNQYYQSLKGR